MFREDLDDNFPLTSPPQSALTETFGAIDIGWEALGPAIACTALATLTVALRWYTRCKIVRCVGTDDIIVLLSLVLAWATCIIVGVEVHEGVGIYGGAINGVTIAKLIVANNNLWSLTVNSTKVSILAQYLRIFSHRRMRAFCHALMFCLLLAACWGFFGGIFLCRPVSKLWQPHLAGHCDSAQSYWTSVAAVDIGLDFFILIFPLPAIASLHLPRKQKAFTLLVFLLGFFVCVVSVIRLATVTAIADRGDFVKSGINSIIWSAVEANVGIVCASLLALKSLIANFFPRLLEDPDPSKSCLRYLPRWRDPDATDDDPPAVGTEENTTTTVFSPIAGNWRRLSSFLIPKRNSSVPAMECLPRSEMMTVVGMSRPMGNGDVENRE